MNEERDKSRERLKPPAKPDKPDKPDRPPKDGIPIGPDIRRIRPGKKQIRGD
jgi:hypothetical protein